VEARGRYSGYDWVQAEEGMNKIEGSFIAASRLESGEQATCGIVFWTTAKQKDEIWRCKDKGRVVVELKADHDAREAEVERLRDANLKRVAEGMSAWCSPPYEQAAKAGEEPIK
jgi:hypothetical protein